MCFSNYQIILNIGMKLKIIDLDNQDLSNFVDGWDSVVAVHSINMGVKSGGRPNHPDGILALFHLSMYIQTDGVVS